MKRIFTIGNVTMALVLVALSMNLMACGKDEEKAPQKTETVRNGDFVIKINASGNLESLLSVEIKSNVEGEIEKLHIEEGDFVEKDQILIQIDDRLYGRVRHFDTTLNLRQERRHTLGRD